MTGEFLLCFVFVVVVVVVVVAGSAAIVVVVLEVLSAAVFVVAAVASVARLPPFSSFSSTFSSSSSSSNNEPVRVFARRWYALDDSFSVGLADAPSPDSRCSCCTPPSVVFCALSLRLSLPGDTVTSSDDNGKVDLVSAMLM